MPKPSLKLKNDALLGDMTAPQKIDVQVTPVFTATAKANTRIVLERGGAGSSKSYSMCQHLTLKFLQEKKKKILILRKSLPYLRVSTYLMMKEVAKELGVLERINEEKVMLNWTYRDNMIHFGSLDDPEKIKSSDWSYIWMEEATEFTYRDFMLLKTRLRTKSTDKVKNQMYLSFNPVDESHWIKTELLDKRMPGVGEIHSTYMDNPFLDDDYIADLEEMIRQDRNFHRIYTLGEWGKLDNLIYSNWDVVPDLWPEDVHDSIYGIDFGYNAPSVLVQIGIKEKDVYEKQLIYKDHLTNQMFIEEMKRLIPVPFRKRSFYADSAEPDRIEEIKKAGFNIKPANKKVKEGIDFIKMLRVHISESSGDIIKEKRSYSWRTDKKGTVLDEPVGFLDHAQDAERYGIYTHLRGSKDYKIRWVS